MESKSFVRPSASNLGRPSVSHLARPSVSHIRNPSDERRSTKKRVSFEDEKPGKPEEKKFAVNQYGNRIIKNWCLFARRKIQREREKARKEVVVSEVTENDKKTFRKAYRRLMKQRLQDNLPRLRYLKRLTSTRPKRPKRPAKKPKIVLKEGETYFPCPIDYKKLFRPKSVKQPEKAPEKKKVVVSIPPPPMKKKKKPAPAIAAKKSSILRPVSAPKLSSFIDYPPPPPIRKSTVPCGSQVKPKFKPKIEYPPLTLRKTPWKAKKTTKPRPKLVRLEKTFYPLPVPTLGKSWHYFKIITPQMHILRGHTSQYSKKFGFISNGKQSAFIAVVALVTANMCPMKFWAPADLDEIIAYGDVNYRKYLHRLKKFATVKPPQIKFKIYLSRAMTHTEIGAKRARGVFDPNDRSELVEQIEKLLQEYNSIIFTYCDQSYAIWKVDNAFFILNSEDTDAFGNLVERTHGGCCAIRSPGSINQIVDYLSGCVRACKECYDIYSFKVNEKYLVDARIVDPIVLGCSQEVSEDLSFSRPGAAQSIGHTQQPTASQNVGHTQEAAESHAKTPVSSHVETPAPANSDPPPTGLQAILFENHPQPEFGADFKAVPDTTHGYLKCSNFLTKSTEDKKRAPFVCSAAIAMLRLCKSSLWEEETLEGIFVLGRENFAENVEKKQKKWLAEQKRLEELNADDNENQPGGESGARKSTAEPRKSKTAETQKGRKSKTDDSRQSRKSKLLDDESQQQPASKTEDVPDVPVTETCPVVKLKKQFYEIRSENVVFGKIVKRASNDISIEDGVKIFFKNFDCGIIQGPEAVAIWRESTFFFMFDPSQCDEFKRSIEGTNSCLNWFGSLDDLVKLYVHNIPKNLRQAVFKIAKVDVVEFENKSEDWKNFKSIGVNKWILRGATPEAATAANVEKRHHQSTCISVAALAKTRELGIQSWTPETIDEVIQVGDEFYFGAVMQLQKQEKFADPNLKLSEIGNELRLNQTVLDLNYDEGAISGSLKGDNGLNLLGGLEKLFEDEDLALVTACGVTMSVFRRKDAFYLFDGHDRDGNGKNLKVNDPIDACFLPGSACILRFVSLKDLAQHIVSNLEVTEQPVYNISRVEVTARTSTTPCMFNYKKFGDEPFAAILHSFGGSHEDRDPFKSSLKEKTLVNLIACVSFAKVLNPRHWSLSDVNEILKIGHKILCAAAPALLSSENEEDTWKAFEKIQVCSMDMTVSVISETAGTFSGQSSLLPPAENSHESIEENVNISDIEVRTSRRSVTFSEGAGSYASTVQEDSTEEVKSLEAILQEFEPQKEFLVTLHSTLFEVAIFKADRLFFVFDPRESDDNGMMVRTRLENLMKRIIGNRRSTSLNESRRPTLEEELEELIFGRKVVFTSLKGKPSLHTIAAAVDSDLLPIEISTKGGAYVAWFTSIELLNKHIMSKVPTKFRNEKFSLRVLQVMKEASVEEKLQPWNNFEAVAPNHWILRAGLSQNDTQFTEINRNHQDIANCIIALTFAQLCTQSDWNSTVLGVVLKFGDRLYKKSLRKYLKVENDVPANLRLKLSQIELPVFIRPFVISVNDEVVKSASIVVSADKEPLETMKSALQEFLASSPDVAGILSSKDYHVAVWKSTDNAFMMFDPHEVGPTGVRRSFGFACLQRFTDHKKLVDTFYRSVRDLEGISDYQLTRINVVKNVFVETNEGGDHCRMDLEEQSMLNYSDYNLYTNKNGVRSIRAKEVATIEWTERNIPMGICYAVATLCISRSLDPEFYTRDIIDKILVFGNDLVEECDDHCFEDFDLCDRRSCPDEINWNFELNSVYTNIQMDIFQRGVVSLHPCPAPKLTEAIEEFFNFHCVGVLITPCFVVAIWREAREFFIFYSQPIDEVGRMTNSNDVTTCHGRKLQPGLVVFKNVHELIGNIHGNIDHKLHCKPFELRTCNITMTDLCAAPKPCEERIQENFEEEVIAPAVAAIDECDGLRRKSQIRPKNIDSDIHNLGEILKKKKNHGFIKLSNFEVTCGRLSKESQRFSKSTRQLHSGAICVVSGAMTCLKDLNHWSSETIDTVVVAGNNLYNESSVGNNMSEVPMTMLMTSLNFSGSEVSAKAEPFQTIASENVEREFLRPLLCELFSCYPNGYLQLGAECWAVFKRDQKFYLFDPLGIELWEKKMLQRRAALYRFKSIDAMIEQLLRCLKETGSTEACVIGGIVACIPTVQSRQYEEVKTEQPTTMCCECEPMPTRDQKVMILKEIEPICQENKETPAECKIFDESCAN